MIQKSIRFTDESWKKFTDYKMKLMQKSPNKTVSDTDVFNYIMGNLK